MTDISRVTYVKMPGDKPLGLELKQFESGTKNRDIEIMNEIMGNHETFLGVM